MDKLYSWEDKETDIKLEIIEKPVRVREQLQIYQGQFNTCDVVKA